MPEQIRPPTAPDPHVQLAIRGWNLMGGIDWTALPLVVEMLGIEDLEQFVVQLTAIRNRTQQTET